MDKMGSQRTEQDRYDSILNGKAVVECAEDSQFKESCSINQNEQYTGRRSHTRSDQKKKFLKVLRDGSNDQRERKIRQLKSSDKQTALIARQLLSAYNPNTVVGWRSFLVPSEIFYAAGALPFTPEMSCSAVPLAGSLTSKVKREK